MGKKDAVSTRYLNNSERFAQIWNNNGFGGRQVIRPEYLRSIDSVELMVSGIHASELEILKKYRDTIRVYDDRMVLMIMGIENQEDIHYAMPLRQMLYDVMRYEEQRKTIEDRHKKKRDLRGAEYVSGIAKTDRLMPVLTMVVYWGSKPWDGPKSLHEMLDIPPVLAHYKGSINDYKMNLMEVRAIENLDAYDGELRMVLGFVKYQRDKALLQEFVEKNEAMLREVTTETLQAISVLGNVHEMDRYLDQADREERVDMCQALQEMIMDGRLEEKLEGIKALVETCQEFGATKEETREKLMRKCSLNKDDAEKYVEQYWQHQ
ncbi:MAG: Rpn family recombination-promoting nuclease/putative transposase [Lachnospiraceae bacterium]|nr:Rpn family recombination-promoting nuclease/putative transposase [Lachnospiraceae bacterium]